MSEQLYDVVIYSLDTYKVVSIFRRNLKRRGEMFTAETMRERAELGINTNEKMAAIAPAGQYQLGDDFQE